MALQIWLPLSGSTINYGLDQNVTITGHDTYYADGILGGKALRGGYVEIELSTLPSDSFSIAFWFKGTSSAANAPMISFGDSALVSVSSGHYAFSGSIAGTDEVLEAINASWHHVAITADGTRVKVYQNGELKTTVDQANGLDSVFTNVNNKITIGSADWTGYINDVKVDYNVFSHKLIHDMAKGLVLEYTFNHAGFGGENILSGSDDSVKFATSATFTAIENNKFFADLTVGKYTLSADTDGTWASSNSTAGQDPSKNMVGLEIYQINGSNSEVINRTFYDMSKGYATVDIVSDGRYFVGFLAYSDGTTEITPSIYFIKLEEGEEATAYTPPVNTALYRAYGLNTEEIEVSGNKLNGDFTNIVPIWVSDSPVFSGAYNFANGAGISSPNLVLSQIANNFTASIWAKGSTSGVLFSTDSGLFVESPASILDGKWHQITVTPTKLYVDGVENASVSLTMENGKINFGSLTVGINWNGLLSDFRLYNRIFSEDEIKKLYTVKAAIDNSGQIFANEFVGGFRNQISMHRAKNGVVNAKDINTCTGSSVANMTSVEKFNIGKTSINAVELIEAQ